MRGSQNIIPLIKVALVYIFLFLLRPLMWESVMNLEFGVLKSISDYYIVYTIIQVIWARRRFFYYVFHIQWQKYLFENVDSFLHLMWNSFCHFYRANSTKTNLWTCNLWTKWSVSYKSLNLFWLNYFCHWMWKTFCYSDRANSNL